MSFFTNLERLDIGNNEFLELPPVVGCLVNLKELWMDSNGLRELPPEIGLLRQLLFLDVSKNNLERLPPELECLQSLTDLYLSNNVLMELLGNIGALNNLQTLKVDDNHLVELPDSIGRLTKIEELVINHNELESLPPSIGLLKKLQILYADENFLEAIPLELGSCISMTILSLRDNRIVRIPDDIGRMPNLQVINLACNRLECLPYTFRKLTSLKALWLSENQSKPMVPLQSDFDHGTQSHVLTCYMFPQQPVSEEVSSSEQQGDSASVPASLLEEQIKQRSSIVFNIDEDDYLARLARFQSPYPKDVKDRATQYLANRRQLQQQQGQDVEVTPSILPPQHQRHKPARHQYRHPYQHQDRVDGQSSQESARRQHHLQSNQKLVPVVVHSLDRNNEPELPRPQEVRTVEVPWYEQQVSQLPDQSSRGSSTETTVRPVSSNHSSTANSLAERRNSSRTSIERQAETHQVNRVQVAKVRTIPGDGLIGGESAAAAQDESVPRAPPVYHPPPPYIPRQNRTTPASPSEADSRQSLESQHSFREEAPSSLSSFAGPASIGRQNSRSTGTPETEQAGEMCSFNEQEPSILQGPLRPPSYYEATNHLNRISGLGNFVHHIWSATQDGVLDTRPMLNGNHGKQRSPPPQYTEQPEMINELPARLSLSEPEVSANSGRQLVVRVNPEDAQRFENRVRQLQRERAMERREMENNGGRRDVGDNRRAQPQATAFVPRVRLQRSNSSDSRSSQQSLHSTHSSQDVDEEPLDNDPSVELHRVEVYKNPNLGFSIAGGIDSTANPFHPNDNKSIYVTKVQPDGPAAYGLVPGDRILEVNGINLRRVTHEKAVLFLKNNQVVNLLVARDKEAPS